MGATAYLPSLLSRMEARESTARGLSMTRPRVRDDRIQQAVHALASVANRVAGALVNGEDLDDGDVQALRYLAYEYLRDPSCAWRDVKGE
jgi:hypothetical protein